MRLSSSAHGLCCLLVRPQSERLDISLSPGEVLSHESTRIPIPAVSTDENDFFKELTG